MQGMADVIRYVPGVTVAQGEGNRDQVTIRATHRQRISSSMVCGMTLSFSGTSTILSESKPSRDRTRWYLVEVAEVACSIA